MDSHGRLIVACKDGIYMLRMDDAFEKIAYKGVNSCSKPESWLTSLVSGPDGEIYLAGSGGVQSLRDGVIKNTTFNHPFRWHTTLRISPGTGNLIIMDRNNPRIHEFTKDGKHIGTTEWTRLEQFITCAWETVYHYGPLIFAVDPERTSPLIMHGEGVSMDVLRVRLQDGESAWSLPVTSSTIQRGCLPHRTHRNGRPQDGYDYYYRFIASDRECLYIMYDRRIKCVWMNPRWNPSMHHRFDRQAKHAIRALLLLRYRADNLFQNLPRELLPELFSWLIS